MNGFDENGGYSPIERDPVLESMLKECKTEEEKDKVMDEYITMRVKIAIISIVAVIAVMGLIAFIVFLSRWGYQNG